LFVEGRSHTSGGRNGTNAPQELNDHYVLPLQDERWIITPKAARREIATLS